MDGRVVEVVTGHGYRDLLANAGLEHRTVAVMIAQIGAIEARELYVELGFGSITSWSRP